MRHLLLIFLLITLLTSIDGGNIRKLRNALNAASDHELELLEMTMDVDMNGDMDMDMDMDADLDTELDLEDPPRDISNANNQGGAAPIPNVPQSTPNPGIIESIKQKGFSLWKKGKGLFGKGEKKKEDKNNGGTSAPGNGKEGDKQGLIKKWKLKLKKGGATTKAKFCRKFQKRPAHCPPCPDRPRKSKKLESNTPITSAPAQMTPSTPMFLESEMEMEMEMSQDMDWSGFPNLLTKFCGPPTCDCPKPKPKKDGFFKKLKLKLKKKNKPTQSNTLPGPTPVNNGQAPSTPA